MATKTPAKGKKVAAPKEKAAKKPPKAAAKPASVEDEDRHEGDEDEDDDDDEMEAAPKPAAKKPAAKPASGTAGAGGEPPAVVPARRLTPEAKAKVNEMVKKGMPLGEALKVAASWETFVAPVKDEPAKLVQGKSFEGGRPRRPRTDDDEEPSGAVDLDDDAAGVADTGAED
jgi:hypothetical protein